MKTKAESEISSHNHSDGCKVCTRIGNSSVKLVVNLSS